MKPKSPGNLFDNKNFLRIFSVVIAVLCWLAVAMTQSRTIDTTFRNVPVNLEVQVDALSQAGLNAIEGAETLVDVKVRGERTVIGAIRSSDLLVTAIVSGITEPNTYDLELQLANLADLGLTEVISINPRTIRVRLDRLETTTIEIEPVINGLLTPAGYATDRATVTPSRVTVTGPQAELDKIARAVVVVDLDEPLERNYAGEVPIQLLDAQGEVMDLDERHLSLDNETAQLVIRVLKIRTLPLVVGFTNVPQNFPLEELEDLMIMSENLIRVAGPVDIADNYQEIQLGYIDLSTLTEDSLPLSFRVTLPSDSFTNMDNINSVVVDFDTSGWSSEAFYVSNLEVSNVPPQYSVTLLQQGLPNVLFIGDAESLAGMTSDDIVVDIDLSDRTVSPGQHSYPVRISAPSRGMVWAVGEYSVIIQVIETAAE